MYGIYNIWYTYIVVVVLFIVVVVVVVPVVVVLLLQYPVEMIVVLTRNLKLKEPLKAHSLNYVEPCLPCASVSVETLNKLLLP